MELFDSLALGFGVALKPINLAYCFGGVFLGTLIGVLPGIGPVAAMSLLLPATFSIAPESAIILMAGVYYGSMYGGSTTAILVNIPGEAASVVTCLDGYQMARQGRAGAALGIAAIGSVIAGTLAVVGLMLVAPWLARFALRFGPAEYFSLMVLGLCILAYLSHGSLAKAVLMAALGLILGLVGLDSITAIPRLTFDRMELVDGLGLVPIVMGLFGVAEILANIEQQMKREVFERRISNLLPTRDDWKRSAGPLARGSVLGFILGILPGGGALLSAFAAYTLEKKLAKDPSQFGKGAIRGVAAPESANNAGAQTSFIPLLTLGIPPNAVMALMVGAMTIHSIQPGPQVMTSNPQLFWGLIASMWLGNLMLVVLNLPMIGLWVKLLRVPYRLLYPAILLFCCIGVYSLNNNVFDVLMTVVFGVLGWVFVKLECEPAPLLLGFILGPLMEENLRRALLLSRGDPTVFFTRPLSLGMLVAAGLLLLIIVLPSVRKTREEAFLEEAA